MTKFTNLLRALFNIPISVLKFMLVLFNFFSFTWKTDEIHNLIEILDNLTENKK